MTGKTKTTIRLDRGFYRVRKNLGSSLAQGLDALGAQDLMHQAALLHHKRLLQVRFERAVGGALGERAIVPEGSRFTAVCTLSHVLAISFLAIIPGTLSSCPS